MPAKRTPIEDRFWSKVRIRGGNECWNWTAALNADGYAVLGSGGKYGRMLRASRVSWSIYNEAEFPSHLHALHSCDNPRCVNPRHIIPGTPRENALDSAKKGRSRYRAHPEEKNGRAILNKSLVVEILKSKSSAESICKNYGVSAGTIWAIRQGRNWPRLWIKHGQENWPKRNGDIK